jgi:hypothetical protein
MEKSIMTVQSPEGSDNSKAVEEVPEEYDEKEDEDEDVFDGHPSWYEPRQCWECNGFYMGREDDSGLCDRCERKEQKREEED